MAAGPTSSKQLCIGVRVPDWTTGYAHRLFDGILDFRRSGAPIRIHFDHPSGADLPTEPITETWDGDGLLVFRHTQAEAKAWHRRGLKVVSLSAESPGKTPDFPRVTLDNRAVGGLAAHHLAALGLREFAYVHDPTRLYSAERGRSFISAIEALGANVHRVDVPVSSFPEATRARQTEECLSPQLSALPRPCGIFAKDDIAGMWVSRILSKLGICCPDEMPVLGVTDDTVFCNTANPPLSSVRYPGRRIGFEATRLLYQMIGGKEVAAGHRIVVPPQTVTARESTRHVVLADEVIDRSLERLRDEIRTRPVTVAELARWAGVSRELLRQRYHAVFGHSPKREIERLRASHVVASLHENATPLEELADELGFSGADDLCRFIKRVEGKTPGQIRREMVS